MFRKMRRNRQKLSPEETEKVLRRGTSGVLAVLGDEGYPYAVPLSYVYSEGKLFFHCAKEGHKLDAVRGCEKASFCVIDRDTVVPEEFTTYFCSVIAFGRVRIIEKEDEREKALMALAVRYAPQDEEKCRRETLEALPRVCMLELEIEHLTGKRARELACPKK